MPALSLAERREANVALGRSLYLAGFATLWLLLTAAAAFRWLGDGRDYLEYLSYYNTIPPQFNFADTRFEPGFHALGWLFSVGLGLDYSWLAFCLVGAGLGIKMALMYRYLRYPLLALVAYLGLLYPLHEYTQIRASFALALGLVAIHWWLQSRYKAAAALFVFAFLFHSSILILAAAFLFARYARLNVITAGGAILAVLALVVLSDLNRGLIDALARYNPLITNYIENVTLAEETRFLSLGNLLFMGALAGGVIAGWQNDRYRRTFFLIATLSVFALAVFAQSPTIAQRTKEALMGAILFAAFRRTFTARDIPAIAMVAVNAAALGALAIGNGLIEL